MSDFESSDGYVQRNGDGSFGGALKIEGVDLSPIEAVYFKKDGDTYLWLKRKPLLEYDHKTESYKERQKEPRWECYLKKQMEDGAVAFKGEFVFLRFRFNIVGVWDAVFGNDKKQRLNLYVERLPLSKQTIINNINERKRKK
jgi:hypothetical protein